MHMSTSIRVSEETKTKLDRVKREGETFDELLSRLADLEDTMAESAGAWEGTNKAEAALEARERMKGSFRSR
jgi:predicted CopG family antitoxin